MAKSYIRVVIMAFAALALLLALAPAALAVSWSDLDGTVLEPYGISVDQVARVSEGFPDGSWHPWQSVTRAQFAKMAVSAFGLAPVSPATPTFSDVAPGDPSYPYVEGASFSGLMRGVGSGLFAPGSGITREQVVAIVARRVAADSGQDLAEMTEAEVSAALGRFPDGASVSPSLRVEAAFAVTQGLVKGDAAGDLAPRSPMTRIAAAAVLIRAMQSRPLVLDAGDNGSNVTVRIGDLIKVGLKGNPTTGYTWTAVLDEDSVESLRQVGEPDYVPDSGLIGAGGTYTFTFRALSAGEAVLKLEYARPWESVPPLETFSVTLRIENAAVNGGASPLEGTSWKLEGWPISSLFPGDFDITASFEGGRVGGRAAVNLYSAPYNADAGGTFSVGAIVSTKMAGPEPAMRAEGLYFGFLEQARSYTIDDGRLILFDEGGSELLIFTAADGAVTAGIAASGS